MHYNFKKYLREYLRNEVRSIIHEELSEADQWLEVIPGQVIPQPKELEPGDDGPIEVEPGKDDEDEQEPCPECPDYCNPCVEVPCPPGTADGVTCWGQAIGGNWFKIYCADGNFCGYGRWCDASATTVCQTVWCTTDPCEMEVDPTTGVIFPCGRENTEGIHCAPYHYDEHGRKVIDQVWVCQNWPAMCGQTVIIDANGNYWISCEPKTKGCTCYGARGCWRIFTADDFGPGGHTQDELDEETIAACIAAGGNVAACIFAALPEWLQSLIKMAFGALLLLALVWLGIWLSQEILELLQEYGEQEGWPTNPNPNDPGGPG